MGSIEPRSNFASLDINVEVSKGSAIGRVAYDLPRLAHLLGGTVQTTFNGVTITADKDTSEDDILYQWRLKEALPEWRR